MNGVPLENAEGNGMEEIEIHEEGWVEEEVHRKANEQYHPKASEPDGRGSAKPLTPCGSERKGHCVVFYHR